MKLFTTMRACFLAMGLCMPVSAEMVPYVKRWNVKLQSLQPSQVLSKIDLERPGLEAVKAAAGRDDQSRAMSELLRYFRDKHAQSAAPSAPERKVSQATIDTADRLCRHVFQWGPYQPADYGADIDWTINPADDIEWVAAVYRFHWADDLVQAYQATHDDKYAQAFVELTTDWIGKHPLEDWTRSHPTLTHWKGFVWLDLQTGIRATRAASAFKAMIHSPAVTPQFLAVFLASMYDHLHKTEVIPMGMVHNKAIFEQRGVLSICDAFPEFSDAQRWVKLAVERTRENLLKQTTSEGAHREWCGSYHMSVLRDAIDIMEKAARLSVNVPEDYRQRVRAMCDYAFASATPDLAFPMFGDTGRPTPKEGIPSRLHDSLCQYSKLWNDPKYEARARLNEAALPRETSYAFESAGIYIMRSRWDKDGVYLALHCAPPAISKHDQADNGTFELYAYGRWLMTDSGFYTYGNDADAREWHRQTRVHQTLTLDGKDTEIDGRLRLWHSTPEFDALVVENPSYKGLLHRRTVWFVDRQFYVFVDEAIGSAAGQVRLHWTPAAGEGQLSEDGATYVTRFSDANVLIHNAEPQGLKYAREDGWFAWDYGYRVPRKMLSVTHPETAPVMFLTVVVPYRGTDPPKIEARFVGSAAAGGDEVQIDVFAFDKQWRIGRSLDKKSAWCEAAVK